MSGDLMSWCGVVWGSYPMSVCYLLQMTVSSASEWKGSAEHQQEAEHCTAVNGTSSNTSFSHLKEGPQKNVEMFMLRYILEFWGTAVRLLLWHYIPTASVFLHTSAVVAAHCIALQISCFELDFHQLSDKIVFKYSVHLNAFIYFFKVA